VVKELKINPKFRDAAIPLSKEKFEELKADIQRRGCLVPIVTWQGTIIDGHNRYAICKELGIDFETVEQQFEDEVDARLWIVINVMNSRDPTSFQRCEMVIPFKDDIGSKALQRMLAGVKVDPGVNLRQGSREGKTAFILGSLAHVSESLMYMAIRLHEGADEATLERLRTDRKVSISGTYKQLFGKKKNDSSSPGCKVENQEESEKRDHVKDVPIEEQPPKMHEKSFAGPVSLNEERVKTHSSEKKDLELYPEVTQIDHLMEVPTMKDEPQHEPHAFMFVEDQVRFACRNYIEELRTGLRWLKNEDRSRLPELLQIIRETNEQAEQIYKEMED